MTRLVDALGGAGCRSAEPECAGAHSGADGGAAGLGQDHHLGQARACGCARGTGKRVLLASLDTQRPAAQLQLAQLGRAGGGGVACRSWRAKRRCRSRGAPWRWDGARGIDVVILDTAGRLSDRPGADGGGAGDPRGETNPVETLLVVDAMTGQDAVNTAQAFNDALGVTGVVLTRMDGDARGGAALSMRHVTGAPIKFSGSGEKLDALEEFHPERVAGPYPRAWAISSGLVERAAETIDQGEADKLAKQDDEGRLHAGGLFERN